MMQDSIQVREPEGWHSVNGVIVPQSEESVTVIPRQAQELPAPKKTVKTVTVKSRHEIPSLLSYPYVAPAKADMTAHADTAAGMPRTVQTVQIPYALPLDSAALAADSLQGPVPGEVMEGLVLINPASAYTVKTLPEVQKPIGHWWSAGMSWIYLGLAVLFCVIGIRFKNNTRYLSALVSDLTDTRLRHNAFDDTVRETSILVLLNVLWAACAGIFLWQAVKLFHPLIPGFSFSIPDNQAGGIAICMGVAAAYLILINFAYLTVGNVFSDSGKTKLWMKGAGAATGLQTFLLFPLALLLLGYQAWAPIILILAASVFAIGKIVFLFKGFRIFFNQISSWLLFLYYLCSLEIVPLILTYLAALLACSAWL